jgi:hypothetical protein
MLACAQSQGSLTMADSGKSRRLPSLAAAIVAAAIVLMAAGIAMSALPDGAAQPQAKAGGNTAALVRPHTDAVTPSPRAVGRGQSAAPVTNRDLVYPVVSIHATPLTQDLHQPITFDGSSSTDSGGTISSYAWDFGDGATGTGATVQHSYAFPGPKHVILSVTSSDGLTSTAAVDVSINGASPVRPLPGCWTSRLVRNDDLSSTTAVPLGFPLDFFGSSHDSAWINNNGNVTFDGPLSDYTPTDLSGTRHAIIAAFFADVDTRAPASSRVTYGQTNLGGRPAFCVNWGGEGGAVGYFAKHADKLNRFQLLLVDRSDIAPGNFDIEMNYDQVQWETGDASTGTGGLGGVSARVGYSNGTGDTGSFFELPGSAVNGALLDGGPDSLMAGGRGSVTLGRYVYQVRSGVPPSGGQVRGTVTSAGVAVAQAPVQACPHAGGTCIVTHSNSSGVYDAAGLTAGDYDITALPPAGDDSDNAKTVGPVTVPATGSVTQDIALTQATGPPPGTTVTSIGSGPGGEPIINWGSPLTLTTVGCPEGHSAYQILQGASAIRSGALTLDHTNSDGLGVFVGSISALYPNHGDVVFRVTVTGCTNPAADQDNTWNAYIDPSGTVQTTHGQPIVGATVTLSRSDSSAGPFTIVPTGSSIMAPTNRTNPDTTNAQGLFGWDVLAGYYEIRAEHSSCHDPADPGTSFVESALLTIPPAITGLGFTLDCGLGVSAPGSADFGNQAAGTQSAAKAITVGNIGPGPLTVQAPSVTGANATDFVVASNACSRPVAIGGSCDITVNFGPAAVGVKSAALSVVTNGAAAATTVALSGTGTTSSPPPAGTPPTVTSLPAVSGTPTVGRSLSATTGFWSGTAPISYAFQWQRCAPGCSNITGATGPGYALVTADTRTMIRVVVAAMNAAGSASAASAGVGPIATAAVTRHGSPTVTHATLSGVGRARARLSFTLKAGTGGAPALKSIAVVLPAGMRFAGSARSLAQGVFVQANGKKLAVVLKVRGGRLTITFKTPASSIQVTIARPSMTVSGALAAKVSNKRTKTVRVTLTATDTTQAATRFTLKLGVS